MLSAKGKYGLKALVHLAGLAPGVTTQGSEIATAERIPKKFLDAILADLRNAGIVHAKKGPGGGYMLAKPPSEIRIGEAVRTLDGPLAPLPCASQSAFQPCQDCGDTRGCVVRMAMCRVRDAMSEVLDRMTVADMFEMGNSKRAGLTYYI